MVENLTTNKDKMKTELKILNKKLEKYQDLQMEDIDIAELTEIKEIIITRRKSSNDRILDFLNQINNPYAFLINGIVVQIGFTNNNKDANSCISKVIKNLYK